MTTPRIIRVFPRKTKATPDDALAYFGPPDQLAEADEVHVSVTFTYDMAFAEYLAEQWKHVAPVKIGGVAYGNRGEEFVPGRYIKPGYIFTSRGCPRRCWFCSAWKRDPSRACSRSSTSAGAREAPCHQPPSGYDARRCRPSLRLHSPISPAPTAPGRSPGGRCCSRAYRHDAGRNSAPASRARAGTVAAFHRRLRPRRRCAGRRRISRHRELRRRAVPRCAGSELAFRRILKSKRRRPRLKAAASSQLVTHRRFEYV